MIPKLHARVIPKESTAAQAIHAAKSDMNRIVAQGIERQKQIVKVSVIGIATNIVLASLKGIIGYITGSIAIVSDAVNNLTDSSSSLITIIGTRLARRKPDREHPFGHGRIEYLTSMIISVIVLVTGFEVGQNSVLCILEPNDVYYPISSVAVLGLTVAVKIVLGRYTKKRGRSLESGALEASGVDALNDAVLSTITVCSAIVYMAFDISIDAYAGVLISVFILKTGIDLLRNTLDKMLGERGNKKLADSIYEAVSSETEIVGAHDLVLNNYGPGRYMGSINVEVSHDVTVGEIYPVLHRIQAEIYQAFKVYLVFGILAVNEGSAVTREVWKILSEFEKSESSCIGWHGVVVDEADRQIFCDIILDYDADMEGIGQKAREAIGKTFPQYKVNINIDIEFV